MEKSKKGVGKLQQQQPQQQQQQRPGTEQVHSGTSIQRGESEKIQPPKSGEQLKQKQQHGKSGKK